MKKLGFGLMRLPKTDLGIDVEQVKKMVDLFLDAGCTYFDTAWIYPGSEEAIREALVERYPRDRFLLATKLSAWAGCKTREEATAQFEESLARTGAGYFDYYLLHNMGEGRTKSYEQFDIWSFARQKKAEGKIRNWGFSSHATPEELDELLTKNPDVDFVQLQLNYADWENPRVQSRRCYEVTRKHGKPIIVMEPVKGGLLADPPESVAKILKDAAPDVSCASWAIRFSASLEGVAVVLSGMSSVAQMEDNLSFMREFRPLTEEEQAVVERARKALEQIPIIPCTFCNYCAKVCPQGIGIPGTFEALNILRLYDDLKFAKYKEHWNVTVQGKTRADQCVKCGMCEGACPQQLEIRSLLEEAVERLEIK